MNALIIRGTRLIRSDGRLSDPLDILVKGDTITAIEAHLAAPAATIIDASESIAIPGLVNAHTHANNNLMKSLCDNWTLEDLRNHGSALHLNRTVDDQYLSAAIGAIEMLKTGCTAAYDQFVAVPMHTMEGINAVMQAYCDVGVRVAIAPAFTDVTMYEAIPGLKEVLPAELRQLTDNHSQTPVDYMLELAEWTIRQWNGKQEGLIKVAVAPLIVSEASDLLLNGCSRLSKSYGVGVHTHLAETKVQAISSLRRFGRSLVDRLRSLDVLGPNLVAAHSIWIDHSDIHALADSGTMVAHNPASNLKLGSGIAPVREMLKAGVTVGLGTDGSMASDNQNMFEAMRFAALVGNVRFAYEPDKWISAREVFEMATVSSAKLLGLDTQIGSLEVGRKADIVLLNTHSSFLRPTSNVINSLVYAETAADVDKVFVGGRLVVASGRVLTVNEGDIYVRAQAAVERLIRQNESLFAVANRLEPFVRSACALCAKVPMEIDRHAALGH